MYKFDAVSEDYSPPSWWRCERMMPGALVPVRGEQIGGGGVSLTLPPSSDDAKSWIIESLRDLPGGFQSVRLRAPTAAVAAERAQLLLDALDLTLDGP